MQKRIEVVRGKIENLKRVATRTQNSMITFSVGGTACKAFGKGAETISYWVQDDPNSVGEFEGYFDKRSERFGREFVTARGKLIRTKTIDGINSPDIAASGTGAPGAASASGISVPAEPIPAIEPVTLKTDLAATAPPNPLPGMPQASASIPVVDTAPVKQVTFEDLENEYKLQKMKRQLEKANHLIMTA